MQSIVAIDIETTGLSEDRDAITEIGAVRFKGHRIPVFTQPCGFDVYGNYGLHNRTSVS